MSTKKRVLVFCVPFSGHLNAIKELIQRLKHDIDFTLVITGWSTISPDPENLPPDTIVLEHGTLEETDPAVWTLPRVAALLPQCVVFAEKYKPDCILYDYFSPEGYFVGKMLNIPFWSSIPAMIGPFDTQDYLSQKLHTPLNQSAIQTIETLSGSFIDQQKIEMISDGLHFPGILNLVWSYESVTPKDYQKNRKICPYVFIGGAKATHLQKKENHTKPLIYISFGTVVMNNLWNQQPSFQSSFKDFLQELAKCWAQKPIDVVFVSQGKKILEHYPENWSIVDHAHQMDILAKANVFVTHAGGNSFNEALINRVPMVALPFFGDQILIAQQIETLEIGINLGKDSSIMTKKSKNFLNSALSHELDDATFHILNSSSYQEHYQKLHLLCESLHTVFSHTHLL